MITRFACVSDLHGNLPDVPPCDVLLIAGDVFPGPYFPVVPAVENQVRWASDYLLPWLERTRKHVGSIYAVGGNHDVALEHSGLLPNLWPWHLLCNDHFFHPTNDPHTGFQVHGCPYSKTPSPLWPYEWAFLAVNEADMKVQLRDMMIGTGQRSSGQVDVLLTHCPPHGILDRNNTTGEHCGSTALLELVRMMKPRLHVFGHIHEARGMLERDGTIFVNAAGGPAIADI